MVLIEYCSYWIDVRFWYVLQMFIYHGGKLSYSELFNFFPHFNSIHVSLLKRLHSLEIC